MVFRFFTPILFFAAAGYVRWYNASQDGSVMTFPFIDTLYPAAKGDPMLMGQASVWMLIALGVLTLLLQIRREVLYRRHQEDAS